MKALNLGYNPSGATIALPGDLSFVCKVQKQHSDALGFLPKGAIETYLQAGRVLLGRSNQMEAGYLLGREKLRYDPRITPITQCAVSMDLQRSKLGINLVRAWTDAAFLDGRSCVQCWCADDIDARLFWPAAGFTAVARRWPQNTRGRSLTLWRRACSSSEMGDDFWRLPPLAGFRASKVGRIESLLDGPTIEAAADPQLFLFDLLADDGRLSPSIG